MILKNVDKLYADYRHGFFSKRDFEGKLFEYIMKNPASVGVFGMSKNESRDLLCRLYPRISRAIEKYDEKKGGFSAYLNSIIHFGGKEEKVKYYKQRESEYMFFSESALEEAACSEESFPYGVEAAKQIGACGVKVKTSRQSLETQLKQRAAPAKTGAQANHLPNKKQLLMMVLKLYYLADDNFISGAAEFLDISKEELEEKIEKLKHLRLEKDENAKRAQCRYYSQYYRCKVLEKKLAGTEKNTIEHSRVQRELEANRQRFIKYRDKYRALRREASNSEVAGVLGMSKGSVDSALCLAKRKCEKIIQERLCI